MNEEQINVALQCVLYGIIGVISLFTNLLIFLVIGCQKKMRTRSNFLLFNLALTDVSIVIIGIPITIANLSSKNFVKEGVACNIHGALLLIIFCASNFNLALIAVHRYVLIMQNPYYERVFSKTKTLIAAVLIWVLSAVLFAVPPLLNWGNIKYDVWRAHCMYEWASSTSYLIYIQVLSYTFPLCIMGFCYYKILKYGNECSRRLRNSADPRNLVKKIREKRLTVMLMIIWVVFMLSFAPYAVLVWREAVFKKHSNVLGFIAMVFAYSNSMFDFWIYSAMSRSFRRAGITLFEKIRGRRHRVSPKEIPSSSGNNDKQKSPGKPALA